MTDQIPRSVTFRFDGPESDVRAVLAMLAGHGIPILANHTYRPKSRGGTGVFWDGQIVVPTDAPPLQAEATRVNGPRQALPARRSLPPSRRSDKRR